MRKCVKKMQSQSSSAPKTNPGDKEVGRPEIQPPPHSQALGSHKTKQMNEVLEKVNSEISSHITTEMVTMVKNMLSNSRADTDKT